MGDKLMDKHTQVLDYIAEQFGVEKNYYNNKSRFKKYMMPRKMACWVLYAAGGIKMSEVADIMGYAEHTTVHHHVHDYWNMCRSDDDFKAMGEHIYSKSIEIYEAN